MTFNYSSVRWQWRRLLRPLRRRLLRHLYRDTDPRLSQSILVAGTARSGTTWLGDMLAGRDGRILFEPFHPHKITALKHLPYLPYLSPDTDAARLHAYAQRVFSGRVRHAWVDREVNALRPTFRVVKDVRATLMLDWLHHHFPEVVQILIMRHPCAVVLSRMQLDWATDGDIASFLAQPTLIDDWLTPYLDVIARAQTAVEKHAVIWCVSYLLPLQRPSARTLVFYEDLVAHTDRELARLGQAIGRRMEASDARRPSATAVASSAVVTGDNRLTRWQQALTPDQIRRVLAIVAAFGLDYLYDDGATPQLSPEDLVHAG